MKFTIATLLALAAAASAYPSVDSNGFVKRQNVVANIDVQVPAMTDAAGNVIPFDATKVYQAAKAQGL